MKSAPILLVAFGLLLLYVILSNSYGCFTEFFSCLTGADMRTPEGYTRGTPTSTAPIVPRKPDAGHILPQQFDFCWNTPEGCGLWPW